MAAGSPSPASAFLQEFLVESFSRGAEGLMLKQLDSGGYQPSKRSDSWLKVRGRNAIGQNFPLFLIAARVGE